MKMKSVLGVFAIWVFSASLAAHGQKLYPVQGPLSTQNPPPVFSGKIRRPVFSVGGLPKLLKSWTLANGEVATGKCVIVKVSSLNTKPVGTPDSYPPQANLAFGWDAVYGPGFASAHLLGNSIWQGTFQGDQGTVLQVELIGGVVRPNGAMSEIQGVAVDNHGNLYKVVW